MHPASDSPKHEADDHKTSPDAGHATSLEDAGYETANDEMKRRSAEWLPRAIVLAVLLHAALFAFAPDITTANMFDANDSDMYVFTPHVDLPEPPEVIERPRAPVAGSIDISTEITMSPTTFGEWTPEQLSPPPTTGAGDNEGYRAFVPSMVAPRLLNADEVERELRRTYPTILRDAGVGGDVNVNLWLDERGTIVKAEVSRSSGYDLFDEAALKVVGVMKLAPALNRGNAVRVIVTLPVRFTVRQ
jgi:TonB family protein